MKKYYLFFLFFFAADSFAVIEFTRLYDNNCEVGTIPQTLIGSKHGSMADAQSFFESQPWPSECKGRPFAFFNRLNVIFKDSSGSTSIGSKTIGEDGCDFESCKEVAAQQCENEGTTLNQETYVYRSSNDYDSSCNAPPPDEPVKNNEECETLSNNQCNSKGGVSTRNFTDNGDFTYQCDYTCGDGSTGDKFGSNSNNNDGICDPNDPNDLADCDQPEDDPNSVNGSYTPDESNTIDYTADGTNQSDGTGTDNLTNVQGDVLINEIVKLKNENAVQTIKSKNAVVSAVEGLNSNNKLDEVITAINNSGGGGGGQSTDLSPVTGVLDDIKKSIGSSSIVKIQRPTDGVISFWASDYPNGALSVWDDTKASFNNTEYVQFLSTFNPNLSAGTPLDMQLCFNLGAMGNYGCHAIPVDSSIWSAIRIFILVTAGFLCRRIIFGG
jgi:hypothetical protein